MKAKINNNCICCGTCAAVCPVGAIKLAQSGDKYEVDQNKCVGCGGCVNVCPVQAAVEDKETKTDVL